MDEHIQRQIDQAKALMDMRRYEPAITILQTLYLSDPQNSEVLTQLTRCYIDGGHKNEGLEYAQKLVTLTPDDIYPYHLLCYAYRHLGRTNDAIAAGIECLRLDPDYVPGYAMLALCYTRIDYYISLDYADQGLALEPTHYLCLSHKLHALHSLGKWEKMQETLKVAMGLYPHKAYMHYISAWYYLEKGDPHRAMKLYRSALMIDPTGDGYERDLTRALIEANPMRYYPLKVIAWLKKHWISIAASLTGLMLIDAFVRSMHLPVPLCLIGVAIVAAVYISAKVSIWLADYFANLYLWADRKTRHLITPAGKQEAMIAAALIIAAVLSIVLLTPVIIVVAVGIAVYRRLQNK